MPGPQSASEHSLLEIDDILNRLASINPAPRRVVELRVFEGLTREEIAREMGCGTAMIARNWNFARNWLEEALAGILELELTSAGNLGTRFSRRRAACRTEAAGIRPRCRARCRNRRESSGDALRDGDRRRFGNFSGIYIFNGHKLCPSFALKLCRGCFTGPGGTHTCARVDLSTFVAMEGTMGIFAPALTPAGTRRPTATLSGMPIPGRVPARCVEPL